MLEQAERIESYKAIADFITSKELDHVALVQASISHMRHADRRFMEAMQLESLIESQPKMIEYLAENYAKLPSSTPNRVLVKVHHEVLLKQ